jgi:hypothetical protein
MICTICGDKYGSPTDTHVHSPNGKPIDVLKLTIIKNAPALWDEDLDF